MTFPPTGPPPGEDPDGERPLDYPQDHSPAYPPAGPPPWYPPPGYPGPGYPPYHPQPPKPRISVGLAFAGTFIYFLINSVLGFSAFVVAGVESTGAADAIFAGAAALLVLIAFGGGTALLNVKNPGAKGIGLGLMIGWAVTSLVTVGFCTGINPTLYTT